MSSSQKPVEGFDLIIPSTQISLGAWDIIGVLTGVPLGLWISAGLLTRTQRGRRYESELDDAENIEDLNLVAEKYENSLMWKMIGPHQALRLERMRTEIERDKFTNQPKSDPFDELAKSEEAKAKGEKEATETPEVTKVVHPKAKPPELKAKPDSTDENGYEWIKHEGVDWYRMAKSEDDWKRFEYSSNTTQP